jgi:hypothetical protein
MDNGGFKQWQAWRTYKAALSASFVPSHHPSHPLYYACLHPSSVQSFDTNLCHRYPTGSCSANDAASLPTSCAVYVLSIYQAISLSLSILQLHRNLQSRANDVREDISSFKRRITDLENQSATTARPRKQRKRLNRAAHADESIVNP